MDKNIVDTVIDAMVAVEEEEIKALKEEIAGSTSDFDADDYNLMIEDCEGRIYYLNSFRTRLVRYA